MRADIEALKVNHRNLDEKIDSLAGSIRGLAERLDRHHTDSVQRMKTPWANIISAAAVAITIIAGLSHSWIAPIQKDIVRHEEVTKVKIEGLEGKVGELESDLVRDYGELHSDLDRVLEGLGSKDCQCTGGRDGS